MGCVYNDGCLVAMAYSLSPGTLVLCHTSNDGSQEPRTK